MNVVVSSWGFRACARTFAALEARPDVSYFNYVQYFSGFLRVVYEHYWTCFGIDVTFFRLRALRAACTGHVLLHPAAFDGRNCTRWCGKTASKIAVGCLVVDSSTKISIHDHTCSSKRIFWSIVNKRETVIGDGDFCNINYNFSSRRFTSERCRSRWTGLHSMIRFCDCTNGWPLLWQR